MLYMDSPSFVSFFFVIFLSVLCISQAYTFYAGGKEGWVLKPSESYSHWAERNRFQVNDTIVFKYKKGSDSVLVVHKDDYFKCKKDKPIHKLKNGKSKLKFTRSGAFYFISGKDDNCEKGQKLLVVVLSPNHNRHKSPSPATQKPSSSPVTTPTQPPEDIPSVVAPSPQSISPAPAPTKSAAVVVGSSGLVWVFSLIMATVFM
ncbi:early nodulin-like protein 3 [Nicotiana tabacum]|uniref:Early nodulin-like protein 2 n=2 Tax=Nicotiana TaxID=4085 RepID=A0A1S4CXG9_TOBAC|nr:PREDICTED: early nodulin-like protein 2 [Nicotiana sylvestris]XP_016505850.1 PREDICTED: early nodulin-like protein 2 [Nicotiana tabacum]